MSESSSGCSLTREQYEDGAFAATTSPCHGRDLESAALDKDGLVVWNKDGLPTVVGDGEQEKLVALMMKGKLSTRHMNALIEAATDGTITEIAKASLRDLFDEITRFAPPPTSLRGKLVQQDKTAALMWTCSPELRITSCTGNAKQVMREQERALLASQPDLWTLVGSTDPTEPLVSAHLRALCGETIKMEYTNKLPWNIYLSPVVDDDGIVGVIGYGILVRSSEGASSEPPTDATFVLTDPEGTILHMKGDPFTACGIAAPGTSVIGCQVAEIVYEHYLTVVEKPKQFVKRIAEVMASATEETDRIVLTNGAVMFRQMQPLKDSTGRVLARAWTMSAVVAKRAVQVVAALLLLATGFDGDINDDGDLDHPAPSLHTYSPPRTVTLSFRPYR